MSCSKRRATGPVGDIATNIVIAFCSASVKRPDSAVTCPLASVHSITAVRQAVSRQGAVERAVTGARLRGLDRPANQRIIRTCLGRRRATLEAAAGSSPAEVQGEYRLITTLGGSFSFQSSGRRSEVSWRSRAKAVNAGRAVRENPNLAAALVAGHPSPVPTPCAVMLAPWNSAILANPPYCGRLGS